MTWEAIRGMIKDISIEDQKVVVDTTAGRHVFIADGDYCANVYIHNPEEANKEARHLIGQTVKQAYVKDVEEEEIEGVCRNIHFYTIQGDKSALDITLYVDHNGYYGGALYGGRIE